MTYLKDIEYFFVNKLSSVYSKNEAKSIFKTIYVHYFKNENLNLNILLNKQSNNDFNNFVFSVLNDAITCKPIQYILGETIFCEMSFKLNEHVLIPRQETEQLVYNIVSFNKERDLKSILDIGAGSGVIAISLRKMLNCNDVYAIDINENALNLICENAKRLNADIKTVNFNILNAKNLDLFPYFDIIISNPPYVKEIEKTLMHPNVLNYEPHEAIFVPNNNSLLFYKSIVEFSNKKLNKGGQLWFEINESEGESIKSLLKVNNYYNIDIIKDFNNKDRFAFALKK